MMMKRSTYVRSVYFSDVNNMMTLVFKTLLSDMPNNQKSMKCFENKYNSDNI